MPNQEGDTCTLCRPKRAPHKPHAVRAKTGRVRTAKIMIRQFAIDSNANSENICIDEPGSETSERGIFCATAEAFDIAGAACGRCPARGAQKPHGSYSRWLLTWDGSQRHEQLVDVRRTKCGECEKTHAVLPDVAIPYMQHSLLFILGTILEHRRRKTTGKTVAQICAERGVSSSTLYGWKARFEAHSELDLGAAANEKDIAQRYWPTEGAVASGATKDFFLRHGFSFMQAKGAAVRVAAADEIVAGAETEPHKFGIERTDAKDYPVSIKKNTVETEAGHDKNKSRKPEANGAVQDRPYDVFGTENPAGSTLQWGGRAAIGAPGRDWAQAQTGGNGAAAKLRHGRRAGRADQAKPQGQRRDSSSAARSGGEGMRHQREAHEAPLRDTS